MLPLKGGDIIFGEPDRDLDRNRDAVVGEHEALQRLVTKLVVPDGRNDERGRFCRCILLSVDDDARDAGECGLRLGSARLRIIVAAEEVVRAAGRDALKKIGQLCEPRGRVRGAWSSSAPACSWN